jgi:hypothetical protein
MKFLSVFLVALLAATVPTTVLAQDPAGGWYNPYVKKNIYISCAKIFT